MSGINNSILADVKNSLGLNPEEIDPVFDSQVVSCINTSIFELEQLGLGDLGDFIVETGNETWTNLLGTKYQYIFAVAKNYIEVNTRLLFDTPQSGSLKSALDEQLAKATFNVMTAIEQHELKE